MFVGHLFLAFALGALVGHLAGFDERRTLSLGVVVAGGMLLPDLDLIVSVGSVVGAVGDSVVATWEGYWGGSTAGHREVSHTLIGAAGTGLVLGAAAAWVQSRRSGRRVRLAGSLGLGLLGIFGPLVILGPTVTPMGWVGFGVVLAGAVVMGVLAARRTSLGVGAILGGGLLGLLVHPFTDVFLGDPPPMFAPVETAFLGESVVIAADPTLNLLGVTAAELGAVWLGVLAASRLRGIAVRELVDRAALAGLAFPVVMVLLPRPTMDAAHWLGFPLAPFALVGLVPLRERGRADPDWALRAIGTGVATLTVAVVGYGVAYGLFGTA